MGRFYSYSQAAEKLGKSKKTIQNMARVGLIRRQVLDGKTVLVKEDVDAVLVEMGAGNPPLNRKTFNDLSSRVRRLEELMAVVKEVLDLRADPLRPNKVTAMGLYQAATAALSSGPWKVAEVELWVSQFLRFDEDTVRAIGEAVPDPSPWKPFFLLCARLQDQVAADHAKSPSLELERLLESLDKSRRRLRAIAVVWVELGYGTVDEVIVRAMGSDHEKLLSNLSRTTKKKVSGT